MGHASIEELRAKIQKADEKLKERINESTDSFLEWALYEENEDPMAIIREENGKVYTFVHSKHYYDGIDHTTEVEEQLLEEQSINLVEKGERWIHNASKGVYKIVRTFINQDGILYVQYKSEENELNWIRKLSVFLEWSETESRRRFSPIE